MQDESLRYSCQIALPGFGKESQQKLQNGKVLVVGAGGLGCAAAQYLASSGVGTIGVADYDIISISNLHRQILYSPIEVGLLKADIACKKLGIQNPHINLIPLITKITIQNVLNIITEYDIVIDGSDNFHTKYLLNDACAIKGKPLVYAAIYQYEGQLSLLNVLNNDGTYSPNYRDIFPEANSEEIPNCSESGVIPTIAGIIGCMQANEVIKYLTGQGKLLTGKLLMIDASTLESRIIHLGRITETIIGKLPEKTSPSTISPNELRNILSNHLYELIDVRTIEERNNYHIGGKHVPLVEIATIHFGEANKPVIFYCETGRRSEEAVKIAAKQFPDRHFFSLEGGLKAWKSTETIN